jgi:hypothetical protein
MNPRAMASLPERIAFVKSTPQKELSRREHEEYDEIRKKDHFLAQRRQEKHGKKR